MTKMIFDPKDNVPWRVEYNGPASDDLDEIFFLRMTLNQRVTTTVPRGVWPRFTNEELRTIFEKARTAQGVERVEPVFNAESPPERLSCVGGPHDGEIRSREELAPHLDLDAMRMKHYVRAPHGSSDVWLWQDESVGS